MADDLLAQILANLDDDAPRLVYADKLQAQDDPRGELIAVQCELARLGYASRPPSHDWIGDALLDPEVVDQGHVRTLRKREGVLLKANEAKWIGEAKTLSRQVRLERGFVAFAAFDGAQPSAGKRLGELFDAAPMLESLELVMLSRKNPDVLFDSDAVVRQVRELDMPVFGAKALVKHAPAMLRRLSLRGDAAEPDDVASARLLSKWKSLSALSALGINGLGLGADDASKLLAAAGSLEELQLRQSRLGVTGAEAVATSPKSKSLRVLGLLSNGIGAEGTELLARSKQLAELRALDLRKNKIGADGAKAIGAAFPELRTLDLTGNTLGEDGVIALVGGKGLGRLRELCLQQTGIDDDAITALAKSPFLERIRVLSLRSNKIGDAGARALAASRYAKNLLAVNLNNNKIGAAGKKALGASKYLTDARVLA